jgi:SNF2 family DNA or RNA helicase
MPLVFLPETDRLFWWGEALLPRAFAGFASAGQPGTTELVTPAGRRAPAGLELRLLDALPTLAAVSTADLDALPASATTWVLATKLGVELVARERVVPTLTRRAERTEARWAAALSASEDAARLTALAQSMPPAAHAAPVTPESVEVWAPAALLRAYLDALVDALLRAGHGAPEPAAPGGKRDDGALSWEARFRAALTGPEARFDTRGFTHRSLVDEVARWSEPALGAHDRLRACFRLELPGAHADPFVLRFLLQSPDDPSLIVPAADVWQTRGRTLEHLGRAFRAPQETLLEALGRACRLFTPIERSLETAEPEAVELDGTAAWSFLNEGAGLLADGGFGVILPAELTSRGRRRLRSRMRIGKSKKTAGSVASAGLALDELLNVNWEAVIGDHALSARELAALAERKSPLVRFRGTWVVVDPAELDEIQKRLAQGPTALTVREALPAALAGEVQQAGLTSEVRADGALAALLEHLGQSGATATATPGSLAATLRPYQARGLAWLSALGSLGLGACLADDMGLGKTIQLIAFLLRRLETSPEDRRPTLLVAPTSVVGNWERELARFAPSLRVTPHYGARRSEIAAALADEPATLVLTTYGILRRDSDRLAEVTWSVIALDEAQNIKNAFSATARAARTLRADVRFALTGTPVENRLAELWSILEFANPGLLGPLEKFRREFALPIERYGNDDAAERLRRMVAPFVLRRLKSDPNVVRDLPAKNEMKVVCTLTREQATLYKAVVDEELRRIERSDGIERRGRVLALLTHTKQICNHPAQYLGEKGPLAHRSGKLTRVTEMLEEALAAGDKALVFTQFREMGEHLSAHFASVLGVEIAFLHGGTPKRARDRLVERFQDDARGPRVFVLSLKAGGTGLNLTAANHVFHYDRWWNPAVEDQATDRAYRLGQTRAVQVHKFLGAGTVEEKIDRLLEHKRELASKIVTSGERWITELDGGELRELFALSGAAISSDDDEDDETAAARTKPKRKAAGGREVRA